MGSLCVLESPIISSKASLASQMPPDFGFERYIIQKHKWKKSVNETGR
jgi:hypothetical protein